MEEGVGAGVAGGDGGADGGGGGGEAGGGAELGQGARGVPEVEAARDCKDGASDGVVSGSVRGGWRRGRGMCGISGRGGEGRGAWVSTEVVLVEREVAGWREGLAGGGLAGG